MPTPKKPVKLTCSNPKCAVWFVPFQDSVDIHGKPLCERCLHAYLKGIRDGKQEMVEVLCPACKGSGVEPGKAVTCYRCNGRGRVFICKDIHKGWM